MDYVGTKRWCVVAIICVSAAFAIYAALLFYLRATTPESGLFGLHRFLLAMLISTWVVADSRLSKRPQPSFDHGCLIWITFPLYVPYYLISTRRWHRGLVILASLIILFILPWLGEWVAWIFAVIAWLVQPLARLAAMLLHVS